MTSLYASINFRQSLVFQFFPRAEDPFVGAFGALSIADSGTGWGVGLREGP